MVTYYKLTYEVECEEEHEALAYVKAHWNEPNYMEVEEENEEKDD